MFNFINLIRGSGRHSLCHIAEGTTNNSTNRRKGTPPHLIGAGTLLFIFYPLGRAIRLRHRLQQLLIAHLDRLGSWNFGIEVYFTSGSIAPPGTKQTHTILKTRSTTLKITSHQRNVSYKNLWRGSKTSIYSTPQLIGWERCLSGKCPKFHT